MLDRQQDYVVSDGDWKPVKCEFSVGNALVEVRFFCEYGAAHGEALFDLESLQIRRLGAKP